jgi:hypothetical protein
MLWIGNLTPYTENQIDNEEENNQAPNYEGIPSNPILLDKDNDTQTNHLTITLEKAQIHGLED